MAGVLVLTMDWFLMSSRRSITLSFIYSFKEQSGLTLSKIEVEASITKFSFPRLLLECYRSDYLGGFTF